MANKQIVYCYSSPDPVTVPGIGGKKPWRERPSGENVGLVVNCRGEIGDSRKLYPGPLYFSASSQKWTSVYFSSPFSAVSCSNALIPAPVPRGFNRVRWTTLSHGYRSFRPRTWPKWWSPGPTTPGRSRTEQSRCSWALLTFGGSGKQTGPFVSSWPPPAGHSDPAHSQIDIPLWRNWPSNPYNYAEWLALGIGPEGRGVTTDRRAGALNGRQ